MDVRTAAARLTTRERAALIAELRRAAERWTPHLPNVGAFWTTVADMLAEVHHHEQIRVAAEPDRQTLRAARPARR